MSQEIKVALACLGIGKVQRGYERYFSDLHTHLSQEMSADLLVGAGKKSVNRYVPALYPLLRFFIRMLPLGTVLEGSEYRKYRHDSAAYAIAMLPMLLFRKYDCVHVIDWPVARALGKLRKLVPFKTPVIYSNACCAPPAYYPKLNHVQHIAAPLYEAAKEEGVPEASLSLIPCGIDTTRFKVDEDRSALRKEYGVDEDTFVILVISAVKRMHKRVDFIVDALKDVDREFLLWVDGSPEDETLIAEAKEKLGDRCKFTFVKSEDVGKLYKCADLMIHGALEEAFGLVIVEAMSTGLPVITHHSEHFIWLKGTEDLTVEMTDAGELASKVTQVIDDKSQGEFDRLAEEQVTSLVINRFDWKQLVNQYRRLFVKVASG